ncbi:MAG: fructosamine kinase family protein [Bacteroidota bacterium]
MHLRDNFIEYVLSRHVGKQKKITSISPVSGGCIHETLRIDCLTDSFFLKCSVLENLEMFEAEAEGLEAIAQKKYLKTPVVLGYGTWNDKGYLLLEWIDTSGTSKHFWETFGQSLASLHRETQDNFGYHVNNYIGRLEQMNTLQSKWHEFFISARLEPQLNLAVSQDLLPATVRSKFDLLYDRLGELVPTEQPAFLHGDLWSGNFKCNTNQEPVVFDPAVHFGHRETELAFTTLFGGFHEEFYKAYEGSYPVEKGFQDRIALHNLYPLLVHLNLFGTSYLPSIEKALKRFT